VIRKRQASLSLLLAATCSGPVPLPPRLAHIDVRGPATTARVVIEVPFRSPPAPGGVIGVTNEMSPKTHRRFYEIAAAIAEPFSTPPPDRVSSDSGDAPALM
jgi:hypothetical protein